MGSARGLGEPGVLRIGLIGGLELERDGRRLELPALGRARSLLALLALERGPHPRTDLASRFWPDVLDESARTSLRTALSAVRKCLGPDGERFLVASRDSVELVGAATDVEQFERLVVGGQPDDALKLCRGPLLAGLDDDWVHEHRDGFRDRVGAVLERQAAAAEDAGDFRGAIEHTRRRAALDPLDEAPVRDLMRLHSAAGDRAGAVAAYERLSERLRTQLSVAPSEATREAAAALRADTGQAISGVVALMFTDLVGSTEMLSRVGEDGAERLRREHFRLLQDVIAGHGGDEVKNLGDGLMAVFSSIVDAVQCAVAVQQSMARFNARTPDAPLELRVGVNAGEPFRSDDDWFGTPVVVAKRLCDQTDGGRIVVSQLVRELVGGRGGFRFRDLGPLALKGLAAPVGAAEVEWQIDATAAPALPTPLADPGGTELVGRARELARLRAAWEAARAGRPHAVVLAGDPGIGKTRLAVELCRSAHADDGATVLLGRCQEEPLAPFQPFVEALERYVEAAGIDELRLQAGEDRGLLARLLPALQRRLPAASAEPSGDAEADRYRLFEAAARLLREAACARPAILLLDDVQWADEATLLLLVHVLRELDDAPLLVVCTYRATEVDARLARTLAALRRARALEEITLGGLDREEVAALIRARTGEQSQLQAAAMYVRTEGNPFFIEELAREGHGDRVPPSVEDLIRRRLTGLDDGTSRVLAAAAVVGGEFDASLLARITGDQDDRIIDELETAVTAHAVREVSEAPGRFAFAHALIREIVYEGLLQARRALLHKRAGEALEAQGQEAPPALLAHHFQSAGDHERAFEHTVRAARAARRVAAPEAAAGHYDDALALAARLGRAPAGDADVRALLIERAELRHELWDISGATTDAETALAGAREGGDRKAEMLALRVLGFVRREQDVVAAVGDHEATLALAQELNDRAAEVAALSRLSLLQSVQLRFDEAVATGERALALAREARDAALVALALDALKLAAHQLGDLDRLEALTAELTGVLPAEQPWYRGFALMESALVPIARGDWPEAEVRLEGALELALRAGSRGQAAIVREARAWLRRRQGRLDEAVADARSALEVIAPGSRQFVGWIAATLGTALLERGEPEAAAVELERGLATATELGAPGEMLRCSGQLAWARALVGDSAGAAAAAAQTERLLAGATLPTGGAFLFGAHGILGAARALLAAGDADSARSLAVPVLDAAKRAGWEEFSDAAGALLAEVNGQQSGQKTS